MAFKSHDPARQATSPRFHDGYLRGLLDSRRAAMDPPRPPRGMDPAYQNSWMYRAGYEKGLHR